MSVLSNEKERILVSNRGAIDSIVDQAMAIEEKRIEGMYGENWRDELSLQMKSSIEESLRMKRLVKISEVEEFVWQLKRSDSYGRTLIRR